jgi:hypothetical protein
MEAEKRLEDLKDNMRKNMMNVRITLHQLSTDQAIDSAILRQVHRNVAILKA